MSKLKTKVKIGYADVAIKILDKKTNPKWCKDNFGEYDSSKSEILISSGLNSREEANTFLHELLHGAAWISGLTADGNVLSTTKREEVVINTLANSLSQILRDNRWILPYLKHNLIYDNKTRNCVLERATGQHKKRSFSKGRKPQRSRSS
jgi:hypothetical protein